MSTDSYGNQIVRYTVRMQLEPEGRMVEYRAVTSLGELKAAAMAALRLRSEDPEARFASIEIVNTETKYTIDPERDLLDYLGGVD